MTRDCSGVPISEEKERKSVVGGRSIWAVVKLFIKYFSSFKISLKILRIFFFLILLKNFLSSFRSISCSNIFEF